VSYSYSAWASQSTTAAQLAMLQLHIGEVTLQMGPSVSKDGASRSTGDIVQYLALLERQQMRLLGMPDVQTGGYANITRARFG